MITIKHDGCIYCVGCSSVCPTGAIECVGTRMEHFPEKCIDCGLCVKACPNGSITVDRERDPETNKFKLSRYVYRFERCTLCALCVDACKFSALEMGQEFENGACDRRLLVLRLDTPDGVPVPEGEAP